MRTRNILALAIALFALAASFPASASASSRAQDTEQRTKALILAFERKDLQAVSALFDADATLTLPLSFTGRREDAAHFTGKTEALAYVKNAFTIMGRIDFVNVKVSVSADGKESFVQANGDFTTADGRPYQNVYVYHFEWRGGRVVKGLEYGNPVTFCNTFGAPGC
ncbi:nuclear transport factor 2 family protein [Nonomuraea angiospora]|uniref:nuclear transport factor 2 family protein n=1 Tax=Nonomuraea angiospora TaxID=46172 RepID=UPI0029AC216B|nr:nuclear transport factor 2 family protein [Nonomuraea angiospora]MDX3107530.1 nuclear transport factor 2 family protein [Nonomuraea angiospora]